MTIELDLPPELEARLRAEAARLGITPEELAVQIIMEALDRMEREDEAGEEMQKRTHAGRPS